MRKDDRKTENKRVIRRIHPEELDGFSPEFTDEDEEAMEFDVEEADVALSRKRGREHARELEREQAKKTVKKMSLDDEDGKKGQKKQGNLQVPPVVSRRPKGGQQAGPRGRQTAQTGDSDTVMIGLINKRETNKEIRRVSCIMMVLLFAVIAYFVYFNAALGRGIVNNEHNSRLGKIAQTISRGDILSADGELLATTQTYEDGTSARVYPYGRIFAHVIGTSEVNKSGVELSEDYDLVTSQINPMQKVINDLKGVKDPGNIVTTTLNARLQETAYEALGGRYGVAVAIEPSTGRILAMVSLPDYDPNTLPDDYDSILEDTDSKVLLNQALQGQFVPGSIFKVITTLAYLRSGYDPDAFYYECEGYTVLTDEDGMESTLSCYDGEVHGGVDLVMAFAESCNAAYVNVGLTVGPGSLRDTAKQMLFNQKLPTDLLAVNSIFSLADGDSQWKIGATAIGQGDTVMTPLHAAMIAAATANDGELMRPYLVDSVRSAEGSQIRQNEPESAGSLMSASEARILQEMMEAVVSEGTGYNLSGRSYTAAGKTGTAEVMGRGNNAWFIGYAPAEDPKIAVCVLVEDAGTASSDAVPVAAAMFDTYLDGE